MSLENLLIGHTTHTDKGTGLTVFLPSESLLCAWHLCGSAPATRDVNLLNVDSTIGRIDALLFSGGSAYGLGASNGVMQWLLENNRGYKTRYGVVPIVPTACIYDFGVKGMHFPTQEDAYNACLNASKNNQNYGTVGAGTGASVGKWLADAASGAKWLGEEYACMSGGFGYAHLEDQNGLQVSAYAVVNSIGDVIDEHGNVVAGGIKKESGFANVTKEIFAGALRKIKSHNSNTTLVAVFTNAQLDRSELSRIAKMSSAGLARATIPAFTRFDGDVIFAATTGKVIAEEVIVGVLSATVVHKAILKAVEGSVILSKCEND
jgi:L-aminopeptidase/D-esterase-like protein